MKLICILLFAILLSACAKEDNCTDHTVGTYIGFIVANNTTFQGEITITKDTSGGANLVLQDSIAGVGRTKYLGIITADCKTITAPSQTVLYGGALPSSFMGTFQVDGALLSGNAIINLAGLDTQLNYAMTKK